SLKQSQADRDGLSEQLRVSDQRSQELQARLSFLEDQAREQAERKAEQGNSVSAELAALKRALADKEAELEIVRGSRAASESSEADANRLLAESSRESAELKRKHAEAEAALQQQSAADTAKLETVKAELSSTQSDNKRLQAAVLVEQQQAKDRASAADQLASELKRKLEEAEAALHAVRTSAVASEEIGRAHV